MTAVGQSGLAAVMSSAVAVLPAPGRADTTTFWVRESLIMACCSAEGVCRPRAGAGFPRLRPSLGVAIFALVVYAVLLDRRRGLDGSIPRTGNNVSMLYQVSLLAISFSRWIVRVLEPLPARKN